MLELRILSGLNRGAAMPIEDTHTINIGSGDNSDVLILDANIEEHHLSIGYQDGELVLTPIGEVRAEDGSYITEPIIIEHLHAFFLKGTWIAIAKSEDAWNIFDYLPEKLNDTELSLIQDDDILTEMQPIKMSWKSKVFAIGGLLMLASWATASVFLPKDSVLNENKIKTHAESMELKSVNHNGEVKKVNPIKKYYARQELAEILNTKLMELQLRNLVDLKFDTEGWTIDASLDDEDRLRLERAVENFNITYKPKFPINVRILSLNSFLPFKITQIMSGKMAGITTEDGQRFFIGDTIDGYRLVSVQGNKAVFDGKRRIEIVL
ncbi:MAG: FHA domain-containing protein [Chitinophagaceae bacterium]